MCPAKVPYASREKSWHESKQLRKRVAFLLKDSGLIPRDVCFRVRSDKQEQPTDVHGHKIFFALASPVFHAMLYGELKEKNDTVDIPDVAAEAFHCLMAYAYSDSVVKVNSANAMEVLFASKKYLMSKLTRHCYEVIQNAMSPESVSSFWLQTLHIPDDVVEAQCVAVMKRNTRLLNISGIPLTSGAHISSICLSNLFKLATVLSGHVIVLASGAFLELPQDRVVELTSWNELDIQEVYLYNGVKKWMDLRLEDIDDVPIDGGNGLVCMMRHIRFELFTLEQLFKGPVKDGALLGEQLCELLHLKYRNQPSSIFNRNTRLKSPATYRLCVTVFVGNKCLYTNSVNWKLFGTFQLVIWGDVAPKACGLLRRCVEGNHYIRLCHTERVYGNGIAFVRKVGGSAFQTTEYCDKRTPSHETEELERESELAASPGMVCVRKTAEGSLDLCMLTSRQSWLSGRSPHSPIGRYSRYGVVIGKVLDGPSVSLTKLGNCCVDIASDFGLTNLEERRGARQVFNPFVSFEITFAD